MGVAFSVLDFIRRVRTEHSTRTRVILGFFLFPLIIVVCFLPMAAAVFFGLLTVLAAYEYYRFRFDRESQKITPALGLFVALCLVTYLIVIIDGAPKGLLALDALVIQGVVGYWVLARDGDHRQKVLDIGFLLLGLVYIVGLFSCCVLLRETRLGAEWLFFLFCAVWGSDTAAYFGGRALGRTPFFQRISPKKTREGAITGIVAAALIGFLCSAVFFQELRWFPGLFFGGCVGVMGAVGDLFESFIKRGFGVKDSSSLIPGHGGILDRFDAAMFCSPLVYVFQWLIG